MTNGTWRLQLCNVLGAFVKDPRNLQITVLSALTLYGTLALDFVMPPAGPPAALGAALLSEHLLFRFRRNATRTTTPYKSAIISAISSLLLFRSTEPLAYAAVAAIAVSSKTLLRIRGRHFVNPTNGAVILGSMLLPGWISSGQWGHGTVFAFALIAGGSLILTRAGRLDSALTFLAASGMCQLLRHFVLGYRFAAIGHHFANGALWLFALYMITDPRTTPERRWARIAHATLVAALGTGLAQLYFVRDSYLWALLALAPTVPLFDFISTYRPRGWRFSPLTQELPRSA